MDEILYKYMDWPRIEAVVYGEENAPRDVMGPRMTKDGVLIQCWYPQASKALVKVSQKKAYPMEMADEAGYFAALLPGKKIPAYSFEVTVEKDGEERTEEIPADPYRFPCQLEEVDEKRFLAGIHYEVYEKLGAHPMTLDGVEGVLFAVWAPNAFRVSVVGDFNQWDGRRHLMHRMPASGIYELFIPGVRPGALYKYEMQAKGGRVYLKGDPYGFQTELPPAGASCVADLDAYRWQDEKWQKKELPSHKEPLHILELDLVHWKEAGDYKSLAGEIAAYAGKMGYTHVELLPVMEYFDEASAGYNTAWYYAPTRRLGVCEDFMYFVDVLHQNGIGVILDWAAAHFPELPEGLVCFDGTCLYENEDMRRKYHPFWGTLLFNYQSPLVRNFLIANAFFWMRKYHIDGLRLDDVDAMLYLDYGRQDGEWAPNLYGSNENLDAVDFLKHLHSMLRKERPGFLFIAQEEGLWPALTGAVEDDAVGFDYKWNRGFTQDLLDYLQKDFSQRTAHYDQLTFSMVYGYSERYLLTLGRRDIGDYASWLENLPGDRKEKESGLRVALGYLFCHPGKKMSLPAAGVSEEFAAYARELAALYLARPALYELDEKEEGFEWIQAMRYEENILVFLRKTKRREDTLLIVCNFSPNAYTGYNIGVPYPGKYKEILNSDKEAFGGSGHVNPKVKMSKKAECDERADSISVKVPPLGISIYSYSEALEKVTGNQEARKKKAPAKKADLKQEIQDKMEKAAGGEAAALEAAVPKAAAVEKVVAKKASEKKAVVEKAPEKKTVAEKASEKKVVAEKAPKKKAARKAPVKKTPAKKTAADKGAKE